MQANLASEQVTLNAAIHGVQVQLMQVAGLGEECQGRLGVPLQQG